MAVPTITSVTPSTVWTGGQLVVIEGTNFRLPSDPPASPSGPLPDPTPTVEVTVGGTAAPKVEVLSATKLSCKLPAADPSSLDEENVPVGSDLVVKNLDDNGDPIAGESATSEEAVVYARPDLTVEEDGGRVERALIHLLKRQVVDNVVKLGIGPDYGDADVTELADPPGLVLVGPRMRDDPIWGSRRGAVSSPSVTGSGSDIRRPRDTVALEYRLSGYTRSGAQLTSLMFLVRKVLSENSVLEVARDPSDSSKGTIEYQMIVPIEAEGSDTSTPNKDGTHSFDGLVVVIHGVALEDITSFPGQLIEQAGVDTQESEVVEAGEFTP